MTDLLDVEHLRAVNAVLALITFGGLMYRLPQAWRTVASRRLFVALILFPPVIGVGSGGAFALHVPASPITQVITPALTVCYLLLAFVLVRWPRSLNA